MRPIYCVGSERTVAYPRAPSLSSFSFNNFFTSSLFHFFSSYFLFFHFCPDFPKENSNSQSKQRNLPAMSKTQKKTSFLETPNPKAMAPNLETSNPNQISFWNKPQNPKVKIFYLETPNPNQTSFFKHQTQILMAESAGSCGGDGRIGHHQQQTQQNQPPSTTPPPTAKHTNIHTNPPPSQPKIQTHQHRSKTQNCYFLTNTGNSNPQTHKSLDQRPASSIDGEGRF